MTLLKAAGAKSALAALETGRSMKSKLEYPLVFVIGALGYGSMELVFRGHTHWTMFIMGGICLNLVYLISNYNKLTMPEKWIVGAVVISATEFFVGGIVNLTLGWEVWTYADYPMNIMGQICLLFSLLWLIICVPLCPLCIRLKSVIYKFVSEKV